MIKKNIEIKHSSGLQVSLAGEFCDLAMEFESSIRFVYRGQNEANAKSMLSVLGAGIQSGEVIELICEGKDEEEACKALEELLLKKS